MFRSKRLWWAVIVLLFSIQIPTKAHAIKADPYRYKTLIGKATFEYERTTSSYNNTQGRNYSGFRQYYTLDSQGYLFHRLLIIYDTGISYSKSTSGYATSKTSYDSQAYYFRTTFIPRSLIPLTLRTRKTTNESSETTSYGLTWEGRFRRLLPRTKVRADRTISESTLYAQENTDYNVDMRQKLGPSKNEFRYSLSEAENSTDGTASSTSAMDFSNRTEISRNTDFYLGAARGVSERAGGQKIINEGLRVNLSSSPGREFSQTHSYGYNRSPNKDSTSETSTYSGSMRYRFSKRLRSSLSLSTSNHNADSLTTNEQTDSLSTAGVLIYSLGRGFSLSERINYTKNRTSSSNTGQSNLTGRTSLRVTTGVGYGRRLRWAQLRAGYSIGYLEDEREGDPKPSTALTQSFSLYLIKLDAMGYATVDASGRYSYTERLTGNVYDSNTEFILNARNKVWKKYLLLVGSYTREEENSWIKAGNSKADLLSLDGSVLYFKKVKINFGATTESNYNPYDEKSTSTLKKFSISHIRRLYNGHLKVQMLYMNRNNDYGGASKRTTTIRYTATYSRLLLRRIPWQAYLYRTQRTTNGNPSVNTRLTNSFVYQLRAWRLGARHEYHLNEYLDSSSSETRILLTASRAFLRRWL